MPRDRRRSPSGAIAEGEKLRVLAEVRQIAGRDLTEAERATLTAELDRLTHIEELKASQQLEQLASTIKGHRERIERLEREKAVLRDENERLRARSGER